MLVVLLLYFLYFFFLFILVLRLTDVQEDQQGSIDKPSRLGDDHLSTERVELTPKIAVVQCNFDVLVRSLIDARRHS